MILVAACALFLLAKDDLVLPTLFLKAFQKKKKQMSKTINKNEIFFFYDSETKNWIVLEFFLIFFIVETKHYKYIYIPIDILNYM